MKNKTLAASIRQALIGLALAGAPGVLLAQGAPAAPETSTTLPKVRVETESEADAGYRNSRTTTATRTDTSIRDVPQSITVVNSEVITDQAMQSMSDVVRYIPGVTMGQGEGNRDQLTIRGNGTTADFYVDGVRDDTQYFRDVYNVERVEALKGPNAMIFGRGGGGGVINRVTKQADWESRRSVTLQTGSYDQLRTSVDVGHGINEALAFRVNAVYEETDSYRDYVDMERYGINPTLSLTLGDATFITLGYERFSDERVADRGIPSFGGRPVDVDESTFFGDPRLSVSDIQIDALSALVEHEFSDTFTLRNRTRYADYSKFYQNVFPGAVSDDGTSVRIAAYNNDTQRENFFNQTDLIMGLDAGGMKHTLLLGAEFGVQKTENFRNTGNFATPQFSTPLTAPTVSVPVTFGQSATDADNSAEVDVIAVYVQDQIELSSQWQAVVGLRYDSFDLDFTNFRNGEEHSRKDDFISPRVGLIFKPVEAVSLYASYSVSFLPGSGDQFSSLNVRTEELDPEEFENIEVGAKWDVAGSLALSAALFQLDRENTTAPHPTIVGEVVQTGSQRSRGVELEASGEILPFWYVMGGYTWQDVEITNETTAAPAGAVVALTPEHKISLWNRYDFSPSWGVGVGLIYQDEMFTGIDNAVTLPDFTRVDAAVFYTINDRLRAQLNVENLFDEEYYPTAHSNNNITPGGPTAFRLSFTGSF